MKKPLPEMKPASAAALALIDGFREAAASGRVVGATLRFESVGTNGFVEKPELRLGTHVKEKR